MPTLNMLAKPLMAKTTVAVSANALRGLSSGVIAAAAAAPVPTSMSAAHGSTSPNVLLPSAAISARYAAVVNAAIPAVTHAHTLEVMPVALTTGTLRPSRWGATGDSPYLTPGHRSSSSSGLRRRRSCCGASVGSVHA